MKDQFESPRLGPNSNLVISSADIADPTLARQSFHPTLEDKEMADDSMHQVMV